MQLTKAVRFPLENLDLGLFASEDVESGKMATSLVNRGLPFSNDFIEALYNLHGVVCHQGSLHQVKTAFQHVTQTNTYDNLIGTLHFVCACAK